MYPYIEYWSTPDNRYYYKRVTICRYQEGISADALDRVVLRVGFNMSKKYKTLAAYDNLPRRTSQLDIDIERSVSIKMGLPPIKRVSTEDPISLQEYYSLIGYDPKTKKINGKTWLQHIKATLEEV